MENLVLTHNLSPLKQGIEKAQAQQKGWQPCSKFVESK